MLLWVRISDPVLWSSVNLYRLEPHEVFDLIVGTSTGAILAVLLGAKQCTLANAAGMYDKLVSRIFVKKSVSSQAGMWCRHEASMQVQGSTMLVLRRAYYDERNIEAVFDELLGDDDFLDSAECVLPIAVGLCPTGLLHLGNLGRQP